MSSGAVVKRLLSGFTLVLLSVSGLFGCASGGSGDNSGRDVGARDPTSASSQKLVYFPGRDVGSGLELWSTDGTEAGTTLVKDINRVGNSNPADFTVVNGIVFFTADDRIHGRELWKSDGTEEGTVLVKDIQPGPGSGFESLGSPTFQRFTIAGDSIYFVANDGISGEELWKTDGTTEGTVLVKDLWPGSLPSYPYGLTAVDNVLYFSAQDGPSGANIWRIDGTSSEPVMVNATWPAGRSGFPGSLTAVGSTLYFALEDGLGHTLWKSDGTPTGTVEIMDLRIPYDPTRSPSGQYLIAVGDVLYFVAGEDLIGRPGFYELWKTDGTTDGTVKLKDIYSGTGSSYHFYFTAVGTTLYFVAYDAASGRELWKSDGTADGTVLVKDITPGNDSFSQGPSTLTVIGTELLFLAGQNWWGREIWRSDGSADGTVLVTNIGTTDLDAIGSSVYFWKDDSAGLELWKTDGTPSGTVLVKRIVKGSRSSAPVVGGTTGDTLYFVATDGVTGWELWRSDGTAEGTGLVKDINEIIGDSYPRWITTAGDYVYFAADDGLTGDRLWRSDGTSEGTVSVLGTRSDRPHDSPSPRTLTAVGKGLYWVQYSVDLNGQSVYELWKTDGTEKGTVLLVSGLGPDGMTAVGDQLFFRSGTTLWKSDGTPQGTMQVKEMQRVAGYGLISDLTAVGTMLYFVADDSISGRELWKSDGTEGGTVLVKDIAPGSDSSAIGYLTAVGNTLYFVVGDNNAGFELWRSDGTAEGTRPLKEIERSRPGIAYPPDFQFTAVANFLYFVADDGTAGRELWRSDGTVDGTGVVKDIFSGAASSDASDLTAVGDLLYFTAYDGTHGHELWKSDGTAQGTALVKDISPGSGGYTQLYPQGTIGSALFFCAQEIDHGWEIWKTDGTSDGTVLIRDVAPGPSSGCDLFSSP